MVLTALVVHMLRMRAPTLQCVGLLLSLLMPAEGRQSYARRSAGFQFQANFTCLRFKHWTGVTPDMLCAGGLGQQAGNLG